MNLDRICRRYRKAPWEVLEVSLIDFSIALRCIEAGDAQDEIDAKRREREMEQKRKK